MRIIAGDWRGRALTAVGKGDPGAHLRPTTDRVRESLFNMLGGGRFGAPCARNAMSLVRVGVGSTSSFLLFGGGFRHAQMLIT